MITCSYNVQFYAQKFMIYVAIIIRYKLICNAYETRLLQAVIYNIYIKLVL